MYSEATIGPRKSVCVHVAVIDERQALHPGDEKGVHVNTIVPIALPESMSSWTLSVKEGYSLAKCFLLKSVVLGQVCQKRSSMGVKQRGTLRRRRASKVHSHLNSYTDHRVHRKS